MEIFFLTNNDQNRSLPVFGIVLDYNIHDQQCSHTHATLISSPLFIVEISKMGHLHQKWRKCFWWMDPKKKVIISKQMGYFLGLQNFLLQKKMVIRVNHNYNFQYWTKKKYFFGYLKFFFFTEGTMILRSGEEED